MTALTLHTRRFIEIAVPKLHTVYHWVLCTIDALAEAKMRKAEHGIDRCSGCCITIRARRRSWCGCDIGAL